MWHCVPEKPVWKNIHRTCNHVWKKQLSKIKFWSCRDDLIKINNWLKENIFLILPEIIHYTSFFQIFSQVLWHVHTIDIASQLMQNIYPLCPDTASSSQSSTCCWRTPLTSDGPTGRRPPSRTLIIPLTAFPPCCHLETDWGASAAAGRADAWKAFSPLAARGLNSTLLHFRTSY